MNKKDYKIHIIGAGVSGLIAAKVLEENGFYPTVIEATERVGGRVKTDIVNGYQLDHGFQVLLTAYPAAQKYLNFEALDLQKILSGSTIFKAQKQKIIGDPLRDLSFFWPTVFSRTGNILDKLKIVKLNNALKKKKIEEIFLEKEQSTLSYLTDYGFSDKIIRDFFKPFFSGIFLETKLETSSRMFEFVFKMFGEGYAAIPKSGMEAIPKQLFQNLKNTSFKFKRKVESVKDGQITLIDKTKLESTFTIIATDASNLISNLNDQETEWKSCYTLYFETESKQITKKLIGLVPNEGGLINNIFYHTSLKTELNPNKELLSVTVIDNRNLSNDLLVEQVKKELKKNCRIDNCTFIKQFTIPKALPGLKNIQYDIFPSETRITATIFLAGDTQLNGSLNAAILSGEKAAMGVVEEVSIIFSQEINSLN